MISIHRETHERSNVPGVGRRPIYAVGDVHGCYDLLLALLGEIGRDAAERFPAVKPLLIMLGDYIDRGPDSSKVLAALAWLVRSDAVETRLLEGNHEAMLKLFIEHPTEHAAWLACGGRDTLRSYGIEVPDVSTDMTLIGMRDRLLDVMPAAQHVLLDRLEPLIEVGGYAFAHAGVRPGVALARQSRNDLLWIRKEFLDSTRPAASVIVHGHTWSDDKPVILPHRIGIDTGAYQTGVLTALLVADRSVEIIQARRPEAVDRIEQRPEQVEQDAA